MLSRLEGKGGGGCIYFSKGRDVKNREGLDKLAWGGGWSTIWREASRLDAKKDSPKSFSFGSFPREEKNDCWKKPPGGLRWKVCNGGSGREKKKGRRDTGRVDIFL